MGKTTNQDVVGLAARPDQTSQSEPADDALIIRACDGDHLAFAALIRRHDLAMRRLAGRVLGNAAAMDDALQDAYMKAYRNLDKFEGRSSFSTWLYTITYRTCLDHSRKVKRRSEGALDNSASMPSLEPGHSNQLAVREALQSALSAVSPELRAVVLLVDGEGMNYAEAAEVLGIASGTVASRLSRARATIRELLDPRLNGVNS